MGRATKLIGLPQRSLRRSAHEGRMEAQNEVGSPGDCVDIACRDRFSSRQVRRLDVLQPAALAA
jgi:hypothetical protein